MLLLFTRVLRALEALKKKGGGGPRIYMSKRASTGRALKFHIMWGAAVAAAAAAARTRFQSPRDLEKKRR